MPRLKSHKAEKAAKPASKPKKIKTLKEQYTEIHGKKRKAPVRYTEEIGDEICELLQQGFGLNTICKGRSDFPTESSVREWALKPDHPFAAKYTRAREIGYHRLADEIISISDDGSNDYIERMKEEGAAILVDHDHISRSRLRVESRKWYLSKVLPKIYGDKIQHEGGDPDKPINHRHGFGWMTKEQAQIRGWE